MSMRKEAEHPSLTADVSEPVAAIVVAAGSGVRLGDSTAGGTGPKAMRKLAGVSLLRHSVERLVAGGVTSIVLVCRPEYDAQMRAELAGVSVPITVTPGGQSRTDSVRHGLSALTATPQVILVHDAARPLVPSDVVRRVISEVRAGSSCVVPVISLVDSIRAVCGPSSKMVDRDELRAVQTPQGFDAATLIDAYRQSPHGEFTDDASVCESAGCAIRLVEGSMLAMKITRPHDFLFAEALLQAELA